MLFILRHQECFSLMIQLYLEKAPSPTRTVGFKPLHCFVLTVTPIVMLPNSQDGTDRQYFND